MRGVGASLAYGRKRGTRLSEPLTDDLPAPVSCNLPISPNSSSVLTLMRTPASSRKSSVVLLEQPTRVLRREILSLRYLYSSMYCPLPSRAQSHPPPRESFAWPSIKPEPKRSAVAESLPKSGTTARQRCARNCRTGSTSIVGDNSIHWIV